LTVTTTNNVSPGAQDVSLAQALAKVNDGDEIRFNIPGPGPHYIATPPQGYPVVTNNRIFLNGYSQPGSSPNTNSILAPNVAKINVVLDSRAGGATSMVATNIGQITPNDSPGYDETQAAVLAFAGGQSNQVQGLSFLGTPLAGSDGTTVMYFISFARGASGQISGCWLGVDPDGQTVAGATAGITGFLYQVKDATGTVITNLTVDNVIIGLSSQPTNPVQQFNVLVGMPANPVVIEGNNTRISGNFITVLPDGLHDVDVALDPNLSGQFQGAIQIGMGGNNTLIGTDGDGLNDENERNVFGGMVPRAMGGYDHLIEFYGQNPGTNVVIAGNYVGVGIDGQTRFTNGVPVLNASGAQAQYRIGSNGDNLSDTLEGNLIANNYPTSLFPPSSFQQAPDTLSFLSQLTTTTAVSLRGNSLINNFPFPVSPLRDNGSFLLDYYAQALADPSQGVSPTLATNSTVTRLKGTVPQANTEVYSATIVDAYLADPSGITNGIAAGIPQLPQGFVQGIKFLGSFVVNSPANLSPTPGSFEFDISRFKLAAGSQLTVTANYVAPVGFSQQPSIDSITRNDNGVVITWTGDATLQSAPTVDGPWTDETGGSPFQADVSQAAQFYQLTSSGGSATGGSPPLTSPFSNVVQVQ
jgi:hypothetical protein